MKAKDLIRILEQNPDAEIRIADYNYGLCNIHNIISEEKYDNRGEVGIARCKVIVIESDIP